MEKRKLLLSAAAAFFSMTVYSQAGLNTASPASTLDIAAKNATGKTKNADGLLIPRVDRERAQSMENIATSTLIYVNSISTGTASGSAVNMDAVGYYYYDGSLWIKLVTPASAFKAINIYNADGTVDSNRKVAQGDKTLAFTGTAVNAFSVDGTTFSVDAANDRVGIKNNAPTADLEIGSNNATTGAANPTLRIHSNANEAGKGGILEFTENGVGYGTVIKHHTSLSTDGSISEGLHFITRSNSVESAVPTMSLDQVNERVGVGTGSPQKKLHVNGALQVTNELNVGGTANTVGSAGTLGQVLTSNGAGAAPKWTAVPASTDTNIYNANGVLAANRIVTQGDKTLAFTSTGVNAFSVDGATLSVDAANDRLGVGTASPATKLHVEGSQFLNAAVTGTATKNVLDINIGQDGAGYGNRTDNYGINMKTSSSIQGGTIARINFGDSSTSTANGSRYLSFSVGKTLNEILYLNDNNVGIGTTSPGAKLEINNGSVNGAIKIVDGSQGVNKVLTSDASGIGTWKDLPVSTITNIYNANGTLNTDRIVTQGDKTLAFTGTKTNAFSVDGATLSVDAANDRVGIGTSAPQNKLDLGTTVGGTASDVTGKKLALYNNASGTDFYGLGISSTLLQFHAASTATAEPGMVLKSPGLVGIGTSNPGQKLTVVDTGNGNDKSGIASFMANNLTRGVGIGWEGVQALGTSTTADLNFNAKGTGNIIMQTSGTTGNVGIGASPTQKLDVNGNLRVRNINANQGNGGIDRVVVADADGVLKTIGTGAYALFHARLAADQPMGNNGGTPATLLFATPTATSSLYTYNTSTGTLTFNQSGNYLVNMQASFAKSTSATSTRYVLGVRVVPDNGNYISRGSHFSYRTAENSSGNPTIGDLMQFTTVITVPNAGYQVRFTGGPASPATATMLATEEGTSGSGSVSNITIQKI